MKKKIISYEQISRVIDPSYKQVSLSKFFEDPLNVFIFSEGTDLRVIDKTGKISEAHAKAYDKGLNLKGSFATNVIKFGQKLILLVEVGGSCYAIQTVIKSAHLGTLYIEDTSTRFYKRYKTSVRATSYPLPSHFVPNIMQGKWKIERRMAETDSVTKVKDVIIDEANNSVVDPLHTGKSENLVVNSISQGGFGFTREHSEKNQELKHFMITLAYYCDHKLVELELLAIARESLIKDGVLVTNCALLSHIPALNEDLFPYQKHFQIKLDKKFEIYLNDDIRGFGDNLAFGLSPGKHLIKLIDHNGKIYEDQIRISASADQNAPAKTYKLFEKETFSCDISELEEGLPTASGI